MKSKHLVGIDEAGRGPLAGPVAVGVVTTRGTLVVKRWQGIKDSKQLSEKQREAWFAKLKTAKIAGEIDFAVALVSNKVIDQKGINVAIKLGIRRVTARMLLAAKDCLVLLDGGLKAPAEFVNQKTIIRGDEKEPIIALASIVAKVTRDHFMQKMAQKYPNYGFEVHKGYGTLSHRQSIKNNGLSPIHRTSFLKSKF